jgi:hypothetical protein
MNGRLAALLSNYLPVRTVQRIRLSLMAQMSDFAAVRSLSRNAEGRKPAIAACSFQQLAHPSAEYLPQSFAFMRCGGRHANQHAIENYGQLQSDLGNISA